MNNILKIKDLSKTYYTLKGEIKALDKINISVNEGEFLCIVGSSGCGKSTLLSILSSLDDATEGTYVWDRNNRTIGYMLQNDALFPWLNIKKNALLGLKIYNMDNDQSKKYVDKLLDDYGLEKFKNKYPKELSGGMRQRVALIRTLALKPDVLLLDEPFSALDYQTRLAVSKDVYEIIKKERKTVIMITHDIAEAISLADRIVVLSKRPGKVKRIYDMNFEGVNDPIKRRSSKEFNDYYSQIWKDLDINV